MSEQHLNVGDLVRVNVVGKIAKVTQSGDYVVTIHTIDVPVGKSQVTPLEGEKEQGDEHH